MLHVHSGAVFATVTTVDTGPTMMVHVRRYACAWGLVGGFDMTQQEFADRICISQSYVSDMERGKVEVGAEILLRVAREFGRTMEWLLTGEDRP